MNTASASPKLYPAMLRIFQLLLDRTPWLKLRRADNKNAILGIFFAIPASLAVLALLWWRRPCLGDDTPRKARPTKQDHKAANKEEKSDRAAVKALKLEGASEKKLVELQKALDGAMNAASDSNLDATLRFACVDVEAWEKETTLVTEIGMAFFVAKPGGASYFRHRHILIAEALHRRNGCFVEDNRDSFLFGNSETLSLAEAVAEVSKELSGADYIVGHALAGDVAWLKSIGVGAVGTAERGSSKKLRGDTKRAALEAKMVDTQVLAVTCAKRASAMRLAQQKQAKVALHAAKASGQEAAVIETLENKHKKIIQAGQCTLIHQRSLKALAQAYGLKPTALHNGANDAAFTLQVMLSQCGVAFDIPPQTPSRHVTDDPIFIEAQAAANTLASIEAHGATNDDLAHEVQVFALALAGGVPLMEKAFPSTLDAAQRRAVHEAAFAYGLSSCSQDSGSGRFVAVRAKGSHWPEGDVYDPASKRDSGGKKKWNGKSGKGKGDRNKIYQEFKIKI
jgi:hypothetical protein